MLGGYFSHRSPTSAGAKGAKGANAAGPKDCQPTLQCKKMEI